MHIKSSDSFYDSLIFQKKIYQKPIDNKTFKLIKIITSVFINIQNPIH